jgi:hypothetical protein
VSNEPQPGIVDAELWDADGHCLRFTGKQSNFENTELGPESIYPQPGVLLCRVLGRSKDRSGREIVRIKLYGEEDEVKVSPAVIVEGTYNSLSRRPWNGDAEPNEVQGG